MFIVSLTYKQPLTEIDKHAEEHGHFLDHYYGEDKFLVSGRMQPRTGGIILAYNCTKAELRAILDEDPFHVHGLADYEITEFQPTKYADSFAVFI